MDYKITSFEPGEYQGYRSFLHKYDNLNTESTGDLRRKWWCFDNPSGGHFAFAHTEDMIVATCYLAGKSISLSKDKSILAYEIGETWTHHEHRRRGLFGKLVKHCEAYAFDTGASVVYGTPNSQSTPGYRKLGYEIHESPSSGLNLSANIFWFLRRDRGVVEKVSAGAALNGEYKECAIEISCNDYIKITESFSRIITTDSPNGPAWRLGKSPRPYRYFSIKKNGQEFTCAIRYGVIKDYPILVVGEMYLNKVRCSAIEAIEFLPAIARSAYKTNGFMGVYFYTAPAANTSTKIMAALSATTLHRYLPFCLKSNDDQVTKKFINKIGDCQLSDCDIG